MMENKNENDTKKLSDYIYGLFKDSDANRPSKDSCDLLAEQAKGIVIRCFSKPKTLRPSVVTRKIDSLSKHLKKASDILKDMDEDSMVVLFSTTNTKRPIDDYKQYEHVEYLMTLSKMAEKAVPLAKEVQKSEMDNNRGRRSDERLQSVVVLLMGSYQKILGIRRPPHTSDPTTGISQSSFYMFVEKSLKLYLCETNYFEPRVIEDAIRKALPSRDYEEFTPPTL